MATDYEYLNEKGELSREYYYIQEWKKFLRSKVFKFLLGNK